MSKHEVYSPTQICQECQGACCLRYPGPYHPSDFPEPVTVESLLKLLESRVTVVDWKQNNGKVTYFLRPPCQGDDGHYFRFNFIGGKCDFLTVLGCSLPFERRPLGCRNLEPNKSRKCQSTYTQYRAFRAWARHKRVLREIYSIVERRKKGDFSKPEGRQCQ